MASTQQPESRPPPPQSSLKQELATLKTPEHKTIADPVQVGSQAPSSSKLPFPDGKPTIVVFLRHCGCPFAEKTFKALTTLSTTHPSIHCIAVSHSDAPSTERWIPQVGGAWDVDVLVDDSRDLYAQWGLGVSSVWHMASPWVLYSVYRLGKQEGIWNTAAESGSRWQISGAFAVDGEGVVKWAHVDKAADDVPDLRQAVQALGIEKETK
ncbi:ahpC/TSA antioxidant enzyme domain-containing protein [Sarocladium implicatum]|nr:ahpC/TSA antioxidant enzyme domain-containing protein [Sarocladium implicatum]